MFHVHDRKQGLTSRQEMIDETSRFLSLALRSQEDWPRIPCRRVDEGGFGRLLRQPGARRAVRAWWDRALDHLAEKF